MGFSIGAFVGGFAEKAVEIEEESAKIGLERLKEAMDDFREEAKDYKPRRLAEIKSKREIARALRSKLTPEDGDSSSTDVLIKQVMDQGDFYAKEFLEKAELKASKEGITVPQLIKIAEGNEAITDFSIEEYINAGGYSTIPEPVYIAPTDMKTGVFGRDISTGQGPESVKSAYMPDGSANIENMNVPVGGSATDLTLTIPEGKFDPKYLDADYGRKLQKSITDGLLVRNGVRGIKGADGKLVYPITQSKNSITINSHAEKITREMIANAQKNNTAITYFNELDAIEQMAKKNPDLYTTGDATGVPIGDATDVPVEGTYSPPSVEQNARDIMASSRNFRTKKKMLVNLYTTTGKMDIAAATAAAEKLLR